MGPSRREVLRMAIVKPIGIVLGLLLLGAGEVAAQCPAHYLCGTESNRTPRGHAGCPSGEFQWDIPIGYVGATQMGGYIRDSLVLTGPPPGSTVVVRMLVHVAGNMRVYWPQSLASASTTLYVNEVIVGGFSVEINQTPPEYGFLERAWNQDVGVDLPIVVGQPFLLMRGVHASSDANMHTYLRFEALPPGSRISSCYGFSSEAPVAAASSTWGALKLRYR
jgi:hypothetical protein